MHPAGVDVDPTIANLKERAELLERIINDNPEHLGQEIERLKA
jgi:hypothetical protein